MENARSKLLEELESVRSELARIEAQLQERGDYGFGKGDPAIYQWEFNLSLRDRYQKHLEQVEAALRRFDEGRYGICEDCGKAIEEERLEALPFADVCIACARKHA